MQRGQDAAGVIVMDKQNRVLLVHQTYGGEKWSIPGGMVDAGESAWAAARRELMEEVNISVEGMELSGLYFQPYNNRYIYTFKSTQYIGQLKVDNNEIDECGFFDIKSLPRPISSFTVQRIIDAVNNTKTVYKEEEKENYEILY